MSDARTSQESEATICCCPLPDDPPEMVCATCEEGLHQCCEHLVDGDGQP